jgi:hypothetical protein
MTTLRIASTSLVYSPGLFRWIEDSIMPHDDKKAAEFLDALGVRPDLIPVVISGAYKKKTEGETLILEIEEA